MQDAVIITGPAGAGRSTAIAALEDDGFEAIDNLPLSLFPRLLAGPGDGRALVVGIDPRTRDFSTESLLGLVESFRADPAVRLVLVYLDCATDTLIRRYSETRRRHPLSPRGTPREGVLREKQILRPLREAADVLIDTTQLSPHELKAELRRWFARAGESERMAVALQSFSFKRGTPRGVDMVMDVRFLANPHWDATLRPLDGRDPRVAAFVATDPNHGPFMARLIDMMAFLLPAYRAEGKAYFSLALGCTGGRHRSVALTEALAAALADDGWPVSIRHRELERLGMTGPDMQEVEAG